MALKQFQGTICFITHDRHLINEIANKIIEIDKGIPHLYPGNYDYYLYKKQQIPTDESQEEARATPASPSPLKKKSSYRSKEERRKKALEIDQFKRQLSSLKRDSRRWKNLYMKPLKNWITLIKDFRAPIST